MPEITAEIIVQPIEATFVQNTLPLNVTVDTTTMSVYAGGFAPPGGNIYEIQFNNNGALGGAPNTAVSNGNISFGNVANVKITGGTSGYYLQTDGSGNLTWAQGTANVSGNGTAAGANTQIQISDGTGNFVAGAGFTFDTASNIFTTPGDIATAGNINGVLIANSNVTATLFTGDGGGLSNINVANIPNLAVGKIANGTSNVDTPVLDGNVTISVGGQPNRFIVQTVGANVEGNLGVTGNVDTDIINANTANITGNLTANNISVLEYANVKYLVANVSAEVAGLTVNSSSIKLGTGSNTGATTVAIGLGAGEINLGSNAVAIGARAGNLDQANNSIILNATGANLTTSTANSFTVKPVRNDNTGNILYYDDTTGEITYDAIGTQLNANFANYAGNVTVSAQPNITSVGTLTSLNVSGNITAANITANTGIFSGNGSGLSAIAGANVTGFVPNAVHANSATTAGSATFATTAGTVTIAAQPNITSVGTLANLTVANTIIVQGASPRIDAGSSGLITAETGTFSYVNATLGNVDAGNVIVINDIISNTGVYYGNGAGLTNLAGANVIGAVGDALFATFAASAGTVGTVTNAAQPNITSVGTLTSLNVSGNITASNITANTGIFTGNGSGLSAIAGANVTGQVGNALIAGTVYTNAQPNITSVGTLTSLAVTGNASAGNLSTTGSINGTLGKQNYVRYTAGAVSTTPGSTYDYPIGTNSWLFDTGALTQDFTLNFKGDGTGNLVSQYVGTNTAVFPVAIFTNLNTNYHITNITVDGSSANVNVFYKSGTYPTSIHRLHYKFDFFRGPSSYEIFVDWWTT